MKDRVVKAVQPYSIGTTPSIIDDELPAESSGKNSIISYRSVPKRSTSRRLNNAGNKIDAQEDTAEICIFFAVYQIAKKIASVVEILAREGKYIWCLL